MKCTIDSPNDMAEKCALTSVETRLFFLAERLRSLNDDAAIAVLRKLEPLLIEVGRASTEVLKPARETPLTLAQLEMNLQTALTALDSAIEKEFCV